MVGLRTLLAAAITLVTSISWASDKPELFGPIPAIEAPGAAARNYPFFAASQNLAALGYVEEEFFIEGLATPYTTPYAAKTFERGVVAGPPRPYRTRLVVRRPVDPDKFNGAVVVEWNNASNGFDSPNVWFQGWEHLTRAGYVWIGVTAQGFGGAQSLKAWSHARYAGLDIPNGGRMAAEPLSLDIFAQVGRVAREGPLLHGLKARTVIAAGQSQSANWLASYVNGQLPSESFDGFLLLSPSAIPLRRDPSRPVFELLAEGDVRGEALNPDDPDDDLHRRWEVASTSHVDRHLRSGREPLEMRDLGSSIQGRLASQCHLSEIGTTAPMQHVLAAALDHLVSWTLDGTPPPIAPRLTRSSDGAALVRDADGRSLGGIRLADTVAPLGVNMGLNSGPAGCLIQGSFMPYDKKTIRRLYGNRASYLKAVTRAALQSVDDGYVLSVDAAQTIQTAKAIRW